FTLDSRFGLDRGFDLYEDSFADASSPTPFLVPERRGTETVALARRWLQAHADSPRFCWVHLYEPHFPYDPPEPFKSQFHRDPYHGAVAAADAALEPLLAPIFAEGGAGRTLVVLTADHGEALGEHGESTHGIFAYEATLRVPLILYEPRLLEPRVVTESVRHVDLLPTILDALALPSPEGLPGRSLLPLAAGALAVEATTSYFEALSASLERGWAPLYGVVRGNAKYIDLPIPELYDLRSDPQETHNLATEQPQLRDQMRGFLAPLRAERRETTPGLEAADTRTRLESLGYTSVAAALPKGIPTDRDDPKRLIGLDAVLQDVVGLYLAGDLRGALEKCQELVRLRPGMSLSLLHLAHLLRESGDLAGAVGALRQAVAQNPKDPTAVSLLGAYLTQAGKAGEAVELLGPYALRPDRDVDVQVAYGLALARVGRRDEALAALEKARELAPSNAMVVVDLGTVNLMTGDARRAREAFEEALAMNPGVARAQSSLAMIAADDGRVEEAFDRWRKAVAIDPREWKTLIPFSMGLWQRGRRKEARAYLDFFVASAPGTLYARDIESVRSWLGEGRSSHPAPSISPGRESP
ncbi:MAG TPA: sulfatase-like hydrolase/transferase, partial [Vicinamibacteria bacterium]|nr:sulfatase-like hydrolase/transferase [Vicinamibacteria bacterium]